MHLRLWGYMLKGWNEILFFSKSYYNLSFEITIWQYHIRLEAHRISSYSFLPWIVSTPWIVSSSSDYIREDLMRKLYKIFKLSWIQKRIVADATIWGNMVLFFYLEFSELRGNFNIVFSNISSFQMLNTWGEGWISIEIDAMATK